MRVLIVNTNRERSPETVLPLGACCIASAARSAGHDVRLLDLTFSRFPSGAAAAEAARFRPDVVGLSVRNIDNCDSALPRCYLPEIRRIAEACRDAGAGTIVLGGPAVTAAPLAVLSHVGGDFAVVGEGEVSFPALLKALASGLDPTTVPGVISARDGAPAPRSAPPADLSSLPDASPADWLDVPRYRRCGAAFPVQTKRGCPFDCSYCLYPIIDGAGVRLRDVELVAADVERAARLGFRTAEFIDSVFSVPEEHAVACCEHIARLRRRPRLQTLELNPLGCSRALVSAMNAAGFSAVGCTAESASDTILDSLGKGFTVDTLHRAARELKKLDALKLWIFMLGAPGETERTVRQTARFIGEHVTPRDLVYISFGVRIMRGTRLHARAVAEEVVSADDDLLWPAFYFSPHLSPQGAVSIIASSGFPSANIVSLTDGNHQLLPLLQRLAHILGLSPPYWRWAPLWNKARRPHLVRMWSGRRNAGLAEQS